MQWLRWKHHLAIAGQCTMLILLINKQMVIPWLLGRDGFHLLICLRYYWIKVVVTECRLASRITVQLLERLLRLVHQCSSVYELIIQKVCLHRGVVLLVISFVSVSFLGLSDIPHLPVIIPFLRLPVPGGPSIVNFYYVRIEIDRLTGFQTM